MTLATIQTLSVSPCLRGANQLRCEIRNSPRRHGGTEVEIESVRRALEDCAELFVRFAFHLKVAPRVLPRGVRTRIDTRGWPRLPIFGFLQRHGEISEAEMLRVFNCGIGMVLVVPRGQAQDVRERLNGMGERAYEIGVIERKTQDDDPPLHYEDAERRGA